MIHGNNSSILSGRAGAEQQLATSYLWFAIFLLISPSFSVLSLPLSQQLFLALPSSLALVHTFAPLRPHIFFRIFSPIFHFRQNFCFFLQISLNLDPNRIFFAENFIKISRTFGECQIIAGTQCISRTFCICSRNVDKILRKTVGIALSCSFKASRRKITLILRSQKIKRLMIIILQNGR